MPFQIRWWWSKRSKLLLHWKSHRRSRNEAVRRRLAGHSRTLLLGRQYKLFHCCRPWRWCDKERSKRDFKRQLHGVHGWVLIDGWMKVRNLQVKWITFWTARTFGEKTIDQTIQEVENFTKHYWTMWLDQALSDNAIYQTTLDDTKTRGYIANSTPAKIKRSEIGTPISKV